MFTILGCSRDPPPSLVRIICAEIKFRWYQIHIHAIQKQLGFAHWWAGLSAQSWEMIVKKADAVQYEKTQLLLQVRSRYCYDFGGYKLPLGTANSYLSFGKLICQSLLADKLALQLGAGQVKKPACHSLTCKTNIVLLEKIFSIVLVLHILNGMMDSNKYT